MPVVDGVVFPSPSAVAVQRFSTTAHWDVPITLPDGSTLRALTHYATPPIFDGPEDRNGLRNRDELRFWQWYLKRDFGTPPTDRYVLFAAANLDPVDGDGRGDAMHEFLTSGLVQDPEPSSAGGRVFADRNQAGDPALDTADWQDNRPGNLRVDYVLPSPDWGVADAGVFWPAPDDQDAALLGSDGMAAGRHRLVWVDLVLN